MEKTQKSLVCFCNKVEVCTGGFVTDKKNATNLYLGADEFWVEDKRQKKNNGRLRVNYCIFFAEHPFSTYNFGIQMMSYTRRILSTHFIPAAVNVLLLNSFGRWAAES